MMRSKWTKYTIIAIVILLPLVIGAFYRKSAHVLYKRLAYPNEVTIATGPVGGRYRPISDSLITSINGSDIGIHASARHSEGSLENLRLLRDGHVHFALFQPDTDQILEPEESESLSGIKFVANLYSQPAHFVVRRGTGISEPSDLRGKSVQLGAINSGDYAMSLMLLEHFGLDEQELDAQYLDYEQTLQGFAGGSLDAAFITIGVQALMWRELFASECCELLPIPNGAALTWNRVAMSEHVIPQGIYGTQPASDIETVALGAQILARDDVPVGLVKEVLGLVMSEDFLRRNQLKELYLDPSFATNRPAFALHPGARSFYEHGFDIHIFEAIDALYSLIVSLGIAGFVLARAWRKRLELSKEHRLDRYMHSLFEIEQRQISLDAEPTSDDVPVLQELLDEVTFLRQRALEELTAHDLNEDPAANSFVEMCHALSNKINSKITRQRTNQGIQRLTAVVEQVLHSREPEASGESPKPAPD